MALNARDAFNSALSLFSSLYEDMAATDLPEGLSPDCQDVWFLPGSVSTRPALNRALTASLGAGVQIVSLADFPLPSGENLAVFLDNQRGLWQRNPNGSKTGIGGVYGSVQFDAATAFDKQFYAFYSATLALQFSDTPFVGVDIPRYFDGQNMWRVTQDAPGLPPVVGQIGIAAATISNSGAGSPLTIVTVAPTNEVEVQRGFPPQPFYVWTKLQVVTSTAHGLGAGQVVTLAGITPSSFNIANAIVTDIINSTTFNIGQVAYFSATGGTGGTATPLNPSMVRSNNIVTVTTAAAHGFQPGWQVQVTGQAATNIVAISRVTRDASGNVTIDSASNIGAPIGSIIGISGVTNPDGSFNGIFTILRSNGAGEIGYEQPGTAEQSTAGTGDIQDIWNGTFIILSVPSSTTFTYFQLGANDSTGGTGTATVAPLLAPGPRNMVLLFKGANGAITAPSIPVSFFGNGVGMLAVSQIAIGPPGTTQRILAFTPAFGANYYYIPPSFIPASAAEAPLITQGTIINDNTTTAAIIDFSDTQLTASVQIDIPGNDLFNQIVLAPCLGVIEYQGRLAWWGEINNLKLFNNMGFDGGYIAPVGIVSTSGTAVTYVSGQNFTGFTAGMLIQINGVTYTVQTVTSSTALVLLTSAGTQSSVQYTGFVAIGAPPGWSSSGSTGGTGNLIPALQNPNGFIWQMLSAGGANDCQISQGAYQNFFGAPILQNGRQYIVRILVNGVIVGGTTAGSLVVAITSASTGLSATAVFPMNQFSSGFSWYTAALSTLPPTIPGDATLSIYLHNATSGAEIQIDEPEFVDSLQPVLGQQLRVSYFGNEFGYDSVTGVIGIDSPANITACFKQRGILYMLCDQSRGSMFRTQNNGSTEPDGWGVDEFAKDVDCAGPSAIDSGEGVAWWVGQSGVRIFAGDQPKKLSQERQPTFDRVNWAATLALFLKNDPIQRILYVGTPLDANTSCNVLQAMSYRSVNTALEPADPLHISYSGKLICSDLCRKWTRWNFPANCADMLVTGNSSEIVFGIGNGQLYSLNFSKFTDDDYGVIASYYTTYFHWNHEIEQNLPQLGMHRKIYNYMSVFATGIGNLEITPLVDSLTNPWTQVSSVWNPTTGLWAPGAATPAVLTQLMQSLTHDLDFPLNVTGDRVAFKIAVLPLAGQTDAYFNLQHLVVAGRMDRIMPVRGAIA